MILHLACYASACRNHPKHLRKTTKAPSSLKAPFELESRELNANKAQTVLCRRAASGHQSGIGRSTCICRGLRTQVSSKPFSRSPGMTFAWQTGYHSEKNVILLATYSCAVLCAQHPRLFRCKLHLRDPESVFADRSGTEAALGLS